MGNGEAPICIPHIHSIHILSIILDLYPISHIPYQCPMPRIPISNFRILYSISCMGYGYGVWMCIWDVWGMGCGYGIWDVRHKCGICQYPYSISVAHIYTHVPYPISGKQEYTIWICDVRVWARDIDMGCAIHDIGHKWRIWIL